VTSREIEAIDTGRARARRAAVWMAVPLSVAVLTWAGRAAGANAPTIGFFYLVIVLALAAWGGQAVGAVASVLAMLCFNFFFLPPLGTLSVEEPANWVALISFLAASTFASRLVAAAQAQAAKAQQRQREIEVLFAKASHLEAVRESEALKTALLRAVSHDLRTPLTAMRLEIESLETRLAAHPDLLPGVHGLALEQARLARRIDNLLALARLEAGVARPRLEPEPPGSLFRAARESLALILAEREVVTHIAPGCPDLLADPSLTVEILVNLLENAARVSPAATSLELAAAPDPDRPGHIRLEVLDGGPGMADAGGDRAAGGLGLRIATSFAEAQGGSLELLDRSGGGTIARVTLPAEPEHPEETA
jgi:two-component system sensor histidine kinase KdpD